jgi:hypothetical protein
MKSYIFPVSALLVASIIFWYKGNAKQVYGLDWSPLRWWLFTSLFTNYLTLHAWWRLIELGDVWKAGVIWGVTSLLVDVTMNSIYFGFNWKGILALAMCGLAAALIHS